MKSLEARIPPPAVALVAALAIAGIARLTPQVPLPDALRVGVAAALLVIALAFSLAGVRSFRLVHTTLNPTTPAATSSLVRTGIYRLTRNPMYLGLSLLLCAQVVYLSCAWALIGPIAFMLYTSHFQIAPEERALSSLFGAEYAQYKSAVRRWL